MRRETAQHSALSTQHFLGGWLERVALFGLLLIITMRPLISETYDSATPAMERATESVGSLTPAATATFDLGILLCCVAAAVSFVFRGLAWPWKLPVFGWLLMLVAAIISTAVASNKRLAANASADWLITALLVLVLPVLCRDRWRIGLLLSVIIASGLTSFAKNAMQVGVEFRETREVYYQNKTEFWARQNISLDDPSVELYERRMRGTAASGFFPHSNVQAGLLGLCGFAAMGLAGLAWPARPARYLCIALGALLLASTILTASKGGVIAVMAGLIILGGGWLHVSRGRFDQNRFVICVINPLIACVVLAFILGTIRGGLPGSSLQFRWQYWQTSAPIIKQHLLTGVGALNFDRAYLLHKPIEYPEEIKDPHNFIVSILAQWGLPGALGLAVMFLCALRPAKNTELPDEKTTVWKWTAILIVGFILLRLFMLRSYLSSPDEGGAALVFFDLGLYGVLWAFSLTGLLWIVNQSRTNPISNTWVSVAIFTAMVAFLIHNLIEFSLFYPGTLTVFAALGGAWLAIRQEVDSRTRSWLPAGLLSLLVIAFAWLVFIPVSRTSAFLAEPRSGRAGTQSVECYRHAMSADAWDPTAADELARSLAANGELGKSVEVMSQAVKRDAQDRGFHALLAELLRRQFELTHDPNQLHSAIDSMRKAVALYPNSPDGRAGWNDRPGLADLLAYSAGPLHDPQLTQDAIQEYQTALDLDAARPGTDEVRRWSPKRRAGIAETIATLRQTARPTGTATSQK